MLRIEHIEHLEIIVRVVSVVGDLEDLAVRARLGIGVRPESTPARKSKTGLRPVLELLSAQTRSVE
jgi:hypothetical protein